jgi:hypothetical protein
MHDPQSLHKYLYTHGDPVQGVDPTGEFLISFALSSLFRTTLRGSHSFAALGALAKFAYISSYFAMLGAGVGEGLLWFAAYNELNRFLERHEERGSGGLDVTNALLRTAGAVSDYWSNLEDVESLERYRMMYDKDNGWDLDPLMAMEEQQRTSFGVPNWARRSVTVDNNVYYGHEVNYFIWGVMNAEAQKKGASISEQGMENWIYAYRAGYGNWRFHAIEHDGSTLGRVMWARAGWKYAMTGTFEPPTGVRLSNATPTTDNVYPGAYGKDTFRLWIGEDVIIFD